MTWSSDSSGRPASTSPRCAASWNCPTQFPPAAQREADEAACDAAAGPAADRTDIPFVTIDPPTSRDLDQAVHLARRPGRLPRPLRDRRRGRVRRARRRARGRDLAARADRLPARRQGAAAPDGARRGRGQPAARRRPRRRCCGPSTSTPTAPPSASALERALVRSRAKLDYAGVQAAADAGTLRRADRAAARDRRACSSSAGCDRGAINLPMPEQELEPDGDGWRLVLRAPVPVEEWNAQISLLTGMAAADTHARPAASACCARCRRRSRRRSQRLRAAAAGAAASHWPDGAAPGQVIADRRPGRPARRRVPRPGRRADARRRLHGLRRCGAGADRPRRRRRPVRPRDRAAAPPGRPVRHRGLPGALHDGRAGAGLGAGGAAAAARGDGRHRPGRLAAERGAIDLAEAVLLRGPGRRGVRRGRARRRRAAKAPATPGHRAARRTIALDDPPVRARGARAPAARRAGPLCDWSPPTRSKPNACSSQRALSPGCEDAGMAYDASDAARRVRADRRHHRRHRRPGPGPGLPVRPRRPAGADRLPVGRAGRQPRRRRSPPCPGVDRRPSTGAANADVARAADVVIIAVPWDGHAATVASLRRAARRQDRRRLRQPARLRQAGPVRAARSPRAAPSQQAAALLPESRVVRRVPPRQRAAAGRPGGRRGSTSTC